MSPSASIAVLIASATTACAHGGAPAAAAAGPTTREPVTGMELVLVRGGCFQMGDVFGDGEVEERPVHEVCVGDLLVGKHEVTRRQWRSVMGSDPSRDRCEGDDCPVDSVSWNEVNEFAGRLNGAGGGFRLPTEAEWEYAARSGGRRERYSGGDDLARVGWFAENSGRVNHPVGTREPNGLGLHDMSGNVWEWTQDWYGVDYYSTSPRDNPTGPDRPTGPNVDRVIRGGCRTGEAANERTVRRSYGYQRTSSDRGDKIGFRVVSAPQPRGFPGAAAPPR